MLAASPQSAIKDLVETDVEEFGDIHFDVAEMMVECGYHDDARPVLERLVASEQFSKVSLDLFYFTRLSVQFLFNMFCIPIAEECMPFTCI